MPWLRVRVRVTPEAVEAAGEALRRAGCSGWEMVGDDTVVGYLPMTGDWAGRVAALRGQVCDLAAFGLNPGPAEVAAEEVQDRVWEEVWKAYFRPTRVGRVVVCPTWEQTELAPGEVLVLLDPGMAFGSGAHATTRLGLLALQETLPAGGRVLDLGTGSGILAIAAARLGASRVAALDTDPEVLPIATENVELNAASDRVAIIEGDITAAPDGPWDVIVANIAPGPVMAAAPRVRDLLAPGGAYAGGGIPASRAQEVQDALTAAGLRPERVLQEEDWVAVVARRDLAAA